MTIVKLIPGTFALLAVVLTANAADPSPGPIFPAHSQFSNASRPVTEDMFRAGNSLWARMERLTAPHGARPAPLPIRLSFTVPRWMDFGMDATEHSGGQAALQGSFATHACEEFKLGLGNGNLRTLVRREGFALGSCRHG